MDDDALEERFAKMAKRIDEGIDYIMMLDVSPSSALYADDQFLWPHDRISSGLIQYRLATALDHLALVVASRSEKSTRVFAQTSLLRTVLSAACTAVWLGTGNADERRLKALKLVAQDHKQYAAYLNTIKKDHVFVPSDGDLTSELDLTASALSSLLASARIIQPGMRKNQLETLHEVDIIRFAGSTFIYDELGAGDPAVLLEAQWRILSGYVHSFPWSSRDIRSIGAQREDGIITYEFRSDDELVYKMAGVSYMVVQRGVHVFNYLANNPEPEPGWVPMLILPT